MIKIRDYTPADLPAIIDLMVPAFQPIFESFEAVLGHALYAAMFPQGVEVQKSVAQDACTAEGNHTLVGEVDGAVAGFLVYKFHDDGETGEIYLLAVDPAFQKMGIGSRLNETALDRMRGAGMKVAFVGTGGDDGHAPARRAYEKAGFTAFPQVQYYQRLDLADNNGSN